MIFKINGTRYDRAKYKGCYCALKSKGILDKVNSITEWDLVRYPLIVVKKLKDPDIDILGENKKFLENNILEPGNIIFVDGCILSFEDPDTVLLLDSLTGNPEKTLNRIVNEIIDPEYTLKYIYAETDFGISWEIVDKIPEGYEELSVDYPYYRVWRERFVEGRDLKLMEDGRLAVKVTMKSEVGLPLLNLIFSDWSVYYDPEEENDEDYLKEEVYTIISWFCSNYERLVVPFDKLLSEEEQIQRSSEAKQ